MLSTRPRIIGTAGHVDHGKTTLVRALTGIDADRLPEEKRRGMTIDLGYAYAGPLGFVDVPGHERLVHTMLAGAAGIDAALLVIAADDGVMPQTVEHARILDLLGLTDGLVAITRADRAPERVAAVAAEARALLAGTGLAHAEAMAVCAPTGQGVAALHAALLALGPRERDRAGHARLAIDRAFTVAGAGLVVTGTLVSGRVAVEDRLVISPAGLPVRVRGLHAHNQPASSALAGQRVALNLTGIGREQVARGDWAVDPALHGPTQGFDAMLRLSPDAPPLGGGLAVHLHLAATHVTAKLSPLGDGLARIVADRPVVALVGDRFVLRDASARRTIGGGQVLDPDPPRRGGRAAGRLHLLAAGVQPPATALAARLALAPVAWPTFRRAWNVTPTMQPGVLAAAGALTVGELAVAAGQLDALRHAMIEALAAHHAAHPDQPGLQPARLRQALPSRPPPALFAAVLAAALRREAVRQDGPWLHLPGHRAVLSGADERLWLWVRGRLLAERFRPPRARDLAVAARLPEPAMRAALKRFARLGRVVEVASDHFFPREVVAEVIRVAAAIEAADGVVTAGALRDRLDNGRKVAIHLLEFLDTAGLTRRDGDVRRLRRDRLDLFGAPP